MAKTKLELPSADALKNQVRLLDHQLQTSKLEAGWLGILFGKGEAQKNNIVGFVCLLLIISGFVFSFLNFTNSLDFWKTIALPIISGSLGYLFGKK